MFKKLSKTRTIRPRITYSDDEDDAKSNSTDTQTKSTNQIDGERIPSHHVSKISDDTKPCSSKQSDTTSTLPPVQLSFFNEDDNKDLESFEVKKTKRSLRAKKLRLREIKLRELRENHDLHTHSIANDLLVDNKSGGNQDTDDMDISPASETDSDGGDDEPKMSDGFLGKNILSISSERKSIPDSNQIWKVKQMRRSAQHADDYISLFLEENDDQQNCASDDTIKHVIDSDYEDEDDRIDMSIKDTRAKNQQQRMFEKKVCSDEDSDNSDEERERWEKDKILQGLQSTSIANVYQNLSTKLQTSLKSDLKNSIITIDVSREYVEAEIESMKLSVSKSNNEIVAKNCSIKEVESRIHHLKKHNKVLENLQKIYQDMFCCAKDKDILSIVERERKILNEAPKNQQELIQKLKMLLQERVSKMDDDEGSSSIST